MKTFHENAGKILQCVARNWITAPEISYTVTGVDMGHVWIRDCLEVMPYAAFVRDEKGIDQHLNNKFYAALDIRKYARLKSDGEGFSQDLKEISTLNSPDYFCGTIPVKDHIASCAQKHPIEIDLEFIEPYGL